MNALRTGFTTALHDTKVFLRIGFAIGICMFTIDMMFMNGYIIDRFSRFIESVL